MDFSLKYLKIGGYCSFFISFFHLVICFFLDNKKLLAFFGAPDPGAGGHQPSRSIMDSPLNSLAAEVPLLVLTLMIAVMFFVFGLYAFSGAGLIRRLPFLKTGLIAIGLIYLFRGLIVFEDLYHILQNASFHPVQNPNIFFSLIAAGVGFMYLKGVFAVRSAEVVGMGRD